jgi:hypothetical protein
MLEVLVTAADAMHWACVYAEERMALDAESDYEEA